MDEIRYTIEYTKPENVESEVPGEQTIRRGIYELTDGGNEISSLEQSDRDENPENYVLSPVVTITKNEATYTKGDMKLQKVSVTENVSVIRNGIYHTVKPESYPPVYSQVLNEQTIRMEPGEEKRARYPTKFKQAATRVRRERSMPNRLDGEITVPSHPRRSSIPRLKRNRNPKPDEDEFDKIYGEIVDSSVDIDISLLNNKVDDPVKVENRFEEIIHDYDEGRVKPIDIAAASNVPVRQVVTTEIVRSEVADSDKGKAVEKSVTRIDKVIPTKIPKGVERSRNIDKSISVERVVSIEKVASVEIPNVNKSRDLKTSTEKRKSIDKNASIDKGASIDKSRGTFLEKSDRVDTPTTTERLGVTDNNATDKTANIEKPKSRIPMLKRKSEPEIEVPKSITIPRSNPFGNRIKVQDAISKFSKDDDIKTKKIPTKIAVNKKIVVDNDNVHGTYHRTVSKTVGDGEIYELRSENVEIKVSYESDIGPEHIVNDVVPNQSLSEGNTVEIVEITPAMENLDISNTIQESTIEPCIVQIEIPPTAPISQNNHQVYIQEIKEVSSPVMETIQLEPNPEENKAQNEPAIKLSPVKVVSIENLESLKREMSKNPVIIPRQEPAIVKSQALHMHPNAYVGNNEEHFSRNIDNNLTETTEKQPEQNKTEETVPINIVLDPQNVKLDNFDKNREDNSTIKIPQEKRELPVKIDNNPGKQGELAEIDSSVNNIMSLVKDNEVYINKEISLPKEKEELPTKNGNILEKKEKTNKTDNVEDDIPVLRGKVSRMISRLVSREERDELKKEQIEEVPKLKSVLSKIAMFERQEPVNPAARTKREDKQKLREPANDTTDFKPKIIDEVLKPIQRISNLTVDSNKDYNETSNKPKSLEENNNIAKIVTIEAVDAEVTTVHQNIAADVVLADQANVVSENKLNDDDIKVNISEATNVDVKAPKNVSSQTSLKKSETEYVNKPVEFKPNENNYKSQKEPSKFIEFKSIERIRQSPFDFAPKADSHKVRNYDDDFKNDNVSEVSALLKTSLDYVYGRAEKHRWSYEERKLNKSKSVAELDLGDAVKGKVHDMIVRIKSVDILNTEKKGVISEKERPRNKTVADRIALFEGKVFQSSTQSPASRSFRTVKKRIEGPVSPGEYQAKLAELATANLTFGRMTEMTYLVLANGQEMPILATGTALLDKQLTSQVVATAIDLGYRAIDAAFVYGNEREVGEGIQAKIKDGTVKREDLFIINKLWSTYHAQELVEGACRRSLDAMGLDYFDLYLVHNPMSFKEGDDPVPMIASVIQYSSHDYMEAWFGMEQLVSRGLARSVGVSNFNSAQLERVLDRAKVKPVINMVECHPYLSQQRLDEFCSERNVKLLCYGVLGSKGTPLEYKGSNAVAIDDPLIQVMAAGLGITPAQLLIRYQIECGRAVVTKASSAAHIWDNLQALSVTLSPSQVEAISALNRNKRTFTFKGMGDTHKNYPFNIAF